MHGQGQIMLLAEQSDREWCPAPFDDLSETGYALNGINGLAELGN